MVRGSWDVNARLVVYAAALLAALFRFPGLLYPLGSDEAGFTLVARAWDPQPDSLYGTYWVDRPPSLIALVKLRTPSVARCSSGCWRCSPASRW